jgi:hypothetical protein
MFTNMNAVTWTVGSYVGTGSALTISSLAFQPDAVLIKSAAATSMYVKISTMPANTSKKYTSTSGVTDAIKTFTSNGFTLGTNADVNTSGVTYYFYAFQAGSSIKVNTYTGNGSSPRTITTSSANISFVMVIPRSSYGGSVSFTNTKTGSGVSGGEAGGYSYDSRPGSSVSTAEGQPSNPSWSSATGFPVQTSSPYTNVNTIVYDYIGFVENAGECEIDSFIGDGTDNRDITVTNFKPQFVMTLNTGGGGELILKGGNVTGGNSQYVNAVANAANLIQSTAIASGVGSFQVGSSSDVNGSGYRQYFVAFGGAAGGVLPIELLHFDAQRTEQTKTQINWSTASEENNDYFTIERSTDGLEFETVGKVEGAENSTTRINYQFTDDNAPADKTVYYRLRQTDKDGMTRTFTVDAVQCMGVKEELEIKIAQNPIANNELVYDMNLPMDATMNVQIIDNFGNVASNQNYYYSRGSNRYSIDAAELKSGVYILNITDLTGSAKKSVRFVVNK